MLHFYIGPFSAVSTRPIARIGAFFSIFRNLQDLQTFELLESDRKTMESVSGRRPPDEAHGPAPN